MRSSSTRRMLKRLSKKRVKMTVCFICAPSMRRERIPSRRWSFDGVFVIAWSCVSSSPSRASSQRRSASERSFSSMSSVTSLQSFSSASSSSSALSMISCRSSSVSGAAARAPMRSTPSVASTRRFRRASVCSMAYMLDAKRSWRKFSRKARTCFDFAPCSAIDRARPCV